MRLSRSLPGLREHCEKSEVCSLTLYAFPRTCMDICLEVHARKYTREIIGELLLPPERFSCPRQDVVLLPIEARKTSLQIHCFKYILVLCDYFKRRWLPLIANRGSISRDHWRLCMSSSVAAQWKGCFLAVFVSGCKGL